MKNIIIPSIFMLTFALSSLPLRAMAEGLDLDGQQATATTSAPAPVSTSVAVEESSDANTDTETVDNAPIAIDGNARKHHQQQMARKRESDKMKVARMRLEEQNEQLMRKKMEQIRLQYERQLTKNMQKAFEKQFNALNSVKTEEE